MRLAKGLALLVAVATAMFFAGFAGGAFSAPGLGLAKTETVVKQAPVLITETVVETATVTFTEAKTLTYTRVETFTVFETVLLLTTVTATRTLTLTINMPTTAPSAPYARVSRGSSISISDWIISVAQVERVEANTTTYTAVRLQLLNSAPWARAVDVSMFSKALLVTNTSRSHEPVEISASRGSVAPGSYGLLELLFQVSEGEKPDHLYVEILSSGTVVRVEFEL